MKLLICTQVVDKNHPILGFFHRWIEEFAKHCEQVHVICLFEGEHHLPDNVQVYSLGKENDPSSSLAYTFRLLKKSWKLRKQYDTVFVHMIPEYVLAGAPVWLLLRKSVSLWYTHGSVGRALRLANIIVKNIFTADAVGMNLRSKKVVVTGHGIDMEQFNLAPVPRDLDMLTVGRITPSKNLEELIGVLVLVRKKVPTATLSIIGATGGGGDEQYLAHLKEKINQLQLTEAVKFIGPVPHDEIPAWLVRAKVFVHSATNGSLDKVLLEALAAGTPVVSSGVGGQALKFGCIHVSDSVNFATEVQKVLESGLINSDTCRNFVAQNHSLSTLIPKIVS